MRARRESVGLGPVLGLAASLALPAVAVAQADRPAAAGPPRDAGIAPATPDDPARADAALRAAWGDPAQRRAAAEALWALHESPSFNLPVNDPALVETRRLVGERFKVTQTPHFVVLSDCDASWTRQKAQLLERTRHQFYRVAGRLELDAVPHATKLLAILFADAADYRAFARAQDGMTAAWVAGYYSTAANRVVFFNDADSPAVVEAISTLEGYAAKAKRWQTEAAEARRKGEADRADRLAAAAADLEAGVQRECAQLLDRAAESTRAKTIHEAVHLLAYNSGVQSRGVKYPFWISEGLASSFETADASGAFGPDRDDAFGPADAAIADLAGLVAAEQVARTNPQMSRDDAEAMYTRSEALVRHLFRFQRRNLGAYLAALRDAEGEVDHPATFRRFFGDPADIERRLVQR